MPVTDGGRAVVLPLVASLETDDRISTVVATLANVEKVFDIESTQAEIGELETCLLYTSPSPRD